MTFDSRKKESQTMSAVLVAAFLFGVPSLVFAQATVWTLLDDSFTALQILIEIGSTLAIVAFFYGIALFIQNSGDQKKRDESKAILTWGVVALFVMITLWGIIAFLQLSLGNYNGPGVVDISVPVIP